MNLKQKKKWFAPKISTILASKLHTSLGKLFELQIVRATPKLLFSNFVHTCRNEHFKYFVFHDIIAY